MNIPAIVSEMMPKAATQPPIPEGKRLVRKFPASECALARNGGKLVVRVIWFRDEGHDDQGADDGTGYARQVRESRDYSDYCDDLYADLAAAITAARSMSPQSWQPLA